VPHSSLPCPRTPNVRLEPVKDTLRIEAGKELITGHCDCCGHETRVFRGFVYRGEEAYAVYMSAYTTDHPDHGVSMAVSLGGWGGSTEQKECVALEWRVNDSGPGCTVVDAGTSRWAQEHSLGVMLSRPDVINSARAREAFDVSDIIHQKDQRLSQALGLVSQKL
jgi:hypothetical protein